VIPAAEKAIETGHADDLARLLTDTVRHEVTHRLQQVTQLKRHAGGTVAEARAYVQAMLGLQVWRTRCTGLSCPGSTGSWAPRFGEARLAHGAISTISVGAKDRISQPSSVTTTFCS
jgi:hypothetical protein